MLRRVSTTLLFALCLLASSCSMLQHRELRKPASLDPVVPSSRLNWGQLFTDPSQRSDLVKASLARVLQVAQNTLDIKIEAVQALHIAGTLNSDPGHLESDRVKATWPNIFDFAVCARLGDESIKDKCFEKARSALLLWATTYQPLGNPIDEGYIVPLFQASDLILPLMTDADRLTLITWLHQFISAGDTFYSQMKSNDSRLLNNWQSYRLMIRGVTAVICGDLDAYASTQALWEKHIATNILDDGSTYDFHQRDALHYHVYGLIPTIEFELLAPNAFTVSAHARVLSALNFMKPFYLGEQEHIEFLNTTVQFDIVRKNAGQAEFFNIPWIPSHARPLLRLARPIYPDIQSWTSNVVDQQYDPMTKLEAAIYGETLSPQLGTRKMLFHGKKVLPIRDIYDQE